MSVFNYKKISQYINNFERQVNQIRAFGKKLSKTYQQSDQQIKKIMQQKTEIIQRTKDPALKKQIHVMDFLTIEREHSQANTLWIRNHLENWIQRTKQLPIKIKERAKELESKRLNKTLTSQQIQAFKVQLMKVAKEHHDSVKEIMRNLSHWNAKNCCSLIQNLTTSMQQMKTAEKKRQMSKGVSQQKKLKKVGGQSQKVLKK